MNKKSIIYFLLFINGVLFSLQENKVENDIIIYPIGWENSAEIIKATQIFNEIFSNKLEIKQTNEMLYHFEKIESLMNTDTDTILTSNYYNISFPKKYTIIDKDKLRLDVTNKNVVFILRSYNENNKKYKIRNGKILVFCDKGDDFYLPINGEFVIYSSFEDSAFCGILSKKYIINISSLNSSSISENSNYLQGDVIGRSYSHRISLDFVDRLTGTKSDPIFVLLDLKIDS